MNDQSFTTTFTVDRPREDVYAAINDVRAWWTGDIDGPTDQLGGAFTYRYGDLHRSTQRITELIPGTRVAWRVEDAYLSFVSDHGEWTGTEITFDLTDCDTGGSGGTADTGATRVRFTHHGLRPEVECYEMCRPAWTQYVNDSLVALIMTGSAAVSADV